MVSSILLLFLISGFTADREKAHQKEPTVKLFIDGKFVESKSDKWIDIHNPATNEVVGRVPQSTKAEMDAAVESCKRAFPAWADTSILSRQQVLLRYQQLIKENLKEIARLITLEQGKTLADAEGDVFRGLQNLRNMEGQIAVSGMTHP